MEKTTLSLPKLNLRTLSRWHENSERQDDIKLLLQGLQLPSACEVHRHPLPEAKKLPKEPAEPQHQQMQFVEQPNNAGQATLGTARRKVLQTRPDAEPSAGVSPTSAASSSGVRNTVQTTTSTSAAAGEGLPARVFVMQGRSSSPVSVAVYEGQAALEKLPLLQPSSSRSTACYQRKRVKEDEERIQQGQPPRKKYKKHKTAYSCSKCGQARRKETGHTQICGNWYCPNDPSRLPFQEWKDQVHAKRKNKDF